MDSYLDFAVGAVLRRRALFKSVTRRMSQRKFGRASAQDHSLDLTEVAFHDLTSNIELAEEIREFLRFLIIV